MATPPLLVDELVEKDDSRLVFTNHENGAVRAQPVVDGGLEAHPNGDVRWTQTRVIELETLLPVDAL